MHEDEADHDGDDLAEGVLLAGEDAEEAQVVSFEPGEEFFDQQQEHGELEVGGRR